MAVKICPQCGKEIPENSVVCPECGHSISGESPQSSPPDRDNGKKNGKVSGGWIIFFDVLAIAAVIIFALSQYLIGKREKREAAERAESESIAQSESTANSEAASEEESQAASEAARIAESEAMSESEMLRLIAESESESESLALREHLENLNSYADTMKLYGSSAQTGVIQANNLLDHVTAVWYNSVCKIDDYGTDAYTKDASGNFKEDFNSAIASYMASDSYKTELELLKVSQDKVNGLYQVLKNAPAEYKEEAAMVGAMQVKFAAVVDSAQNIAGDYNSVKAAQELKTSEFEEAYAKYTESIPAAQVIEGETETLSYDFRYMDFGMTSDEVERAEQENYGLTTTATDWSVDYENVWFSPDLNGSLHYHLDDFRCVDYVRISLDPSVSQEDAYALVTSWYGSDFDGEAKVASDGERPEILVEVLTTGEESRFGSTDIYLAPENMEDINAGLPGETAAATSEGAVVQAETDPLSASLDVLKVEQALSEALALQEAGTEAETEADTMAVLPAGTEADLPAVGDETEAETAAAALSDTEAETAAVTAETEAGTTAVTAATEAETTAVTAATEAETMAVTAATEAETMAVTAATEAETMAVTAATEAETMAVTAATEAETPAVTAGTEAETPAVTAGTEAETSAAAGTEAEIPALTAATEAETRTVLSAGDETEDETEAETGLRRPQLQ